MKVSTLINSVESLNVLMTKELKAVVSFRIGKFLKEAAEVEKTFKEARNNLFKKYGEHVEGSDNIHISKENVEHFNKELEELSNDEVDLKIPEVHLEDLGDITIEPKHLLQLDWLIKE